jgi:lysozyme family protein
MPAAFDLAFAVVVGEEGGYVNNPADPGGETKYGISRRAHPEVNIAALTLDQAKSIYRANYWLHIRGDDLPPPLGLLVFDSAVNNGPSAAAKWLQQAVGVSCDGIIGPATLAAVAKHKLADVMAEFHARRMLFQMTLPTVGTFGLGWARRLARLPLAAMALDGVAPTQPDPDVPAPPPATSPLPPVVVIQDRPDHEARITALEVAVHGLVEDSRAFTEALSRRSHTEAAQ